MSESATIEMVRPTTGMIIGQRAAAQATGCARPTISKRVKEGILHAHIVPGGGRSYCFSAEELSHHVPEGILNPIPADQYLIDGAPAPEQTPGPPFQGNAETAGSDPQRQPPPVRVIPPAEAKDWPPPGEMTDSEIVLTETVTGPDQVMREEVRHLGDLQSAFEYTLENPGRYAVKKIDPESGAAITIRDIDTAPSVSGLRPAATPPNLPNPEARTNSPPPSMLPAPVPPSSNDRLLELLLTSVLSQAGEVTKKMDPSLTVTQLLEMWREGRESGAEIAEDVAGPALGDTNIFDVLNTIVEHVGPNVGEILSLALLRGGDNGSKPHGTEQPGNPEGVDLSAPARLEG